jgi:hypothetical protein
MTNIDYTTDRYTRYGRQFAGYPSPHPAASYPVTPAAAPKSLNGAALAAVLLGTIGVSAAIGAAVFYHADSAPVPPTSVAIPGPAAGQATPQVPGVVSPVIVEPAPVGVAPTWTVQPATIANQPPPPPPSDNPQSGPEVMPLYIPPTKQDTPPGPCAFAGSNCGDQAQSNGDNGSTPSGGATQLPDNSDPKPVTNGAGSTPFPGGGLSKPNQVTLPNGDANLPNPGKSSSPDLGKDFVGSLSPKDLAQAVN